MIEVMLAATKTSTGNAALEKMTSVGHATLLFSEVVLRSSSIRHVRAAASRSIG